MACDGARTLLVQLSTSSTAQVLPRLLLNLVAAVWQDLKERVAHTFKEAFWLNGSTFGIWIIL